MIWNIVLDNGSQSQLSGKLDPGFRSYEMEAEY